MQAPAVAVRDPLLWPRRILIAVLAAAWMGYLLKVLPPVSRGDFLLAIVRQAAAVQAGDWLYALTWPVHVLGGHIVFYERALQLFNYYVLDYSPGFVKACAVAVWILVAFGLYRAVERTELTGPTRLVCLAALALVSFNPIPWEVLSWPDSVIPYVSCLVAILLCAHPMVRILNGPLQARDLRLLVLLAALVVIGSGVGWAIVPVLAFLLLVRAVTRREFRHLPVVAAVGAGALVLAWVLIALFPQTLRLGLVTESLANLDPARMGVFFLALQGSLLGKIKLPDAAWAGAIVFSASMAVYVLYRRRQRGATVAELLFLFGLVGLMLVTLGRWKAFLDRPLTYLPTYYHLFALPFYLGTLLMLARVLPPRRAPLGLGIVAAVLAAGIAAKVPFYDRNLRGQGDSYREMLVLAPAWRMTELARLIGEFFFNQQILFEFLPSLKQAGKYAPLTQHFQPYRSERIAAPQAGALPGNTCNPTYRDLQLLESSADQRFTYTQGDPVRPYWRFVGVARSRVDCDASGVAVSLVAADGTVQCTSRTNSTVHWHYQSADHADIVRSPYAFDFSCPVEGAGPYFLVTRDARSGRQLDAIPWAR